MTLDERNIQGQGSQEVEVEGCNDHIWWGTAQRNPFDREKSLYNKLSIAGYLRDIIYFGVKNGLIFYKGLHCW